MNDSASERDDAGAAEAVAPAAPAAPRRVLNPDLLWVESVTERLLGSSEPPTWERAPIGEQVTGGARLAAVPAPVRPAPVTAEAMPQTDEVEPAEQSGPVDPPTSAQVHQLPVRAPRAVSRPLSYAAVLADRPRIRLTEEPPPVPYFAPPADAVPPAAREQRVEERPAPEPQDAAQPTLTQPVETQPDETQPDAAQADAAQADAAQSEPRPSVAPTQPGVAPSPPADRPSPSNRSSRPAPGEDMTAGVLRAALRDALPDDTARRSSAVDAVFGNPTPRIDPDASPAASVADQPTPAAPAAVAEAPAAVVETPAPEAPAAVVQVPAPEMPAPVETPPVTQAALAPSEPDLSAEPLAPRPPAAEPPPAPTPPPAAPAATPATAAPAPPAVAAAAPATADPAPPVAPAAMPAPAAPAPPPAAPLIAPVAATAPEVPRVPAPPNAAQGSPAGRHRTPDTEVPGTDVTAIRMALRSGDENLAAAVLALVSDRGRERERVRMVEAYLDAVLAEGDDGLAGAARLRRLLGE